ncbi:MAG TPA: ABC transporter ATP-binding protein [Phototrophicaceae bacterium]|nr:ABC transporter ATP-binding protein [Phototrophicaceae bacterium]
MSTEPLLDLQHVGTVFAPRQGRRDPVIAVDDVSFSMPADEAIFLTIVGESGSGKTTLTRNMLGLTKPTSGTIRYNGKDIYTMTPNEWRAYRRAVQPVFQDPYATYNPFYRIDRVLQVPIRKFKLASSKDEARHKIEEALRAVDLRPGDVLGRYPHQLSGGERQRIMLARIYLIRPRVIVADEPLSMVDASLRTVFLNVLLDFREKQGISCIHITHNLATAYYLGGEIMIMCKGQVVERGNMDQVISKPSHPYTRLLIDSVPSPDPDQRWTERRGQNAAVETATLKTEGSRACIFTARCPNVMPICHQQRPQFVPVNPAQEAACFLYGEAAKQPTPADQQAAPAATT